MVQNRSERPTVAFPQACRLKAEARWEFSLQLRLLWRCSHSWVYALPPEVLRSRQDVAQFLLPALFQYRLYCLAVTLSCRADRDLVFEKKRTCSDLWCPI
jgi:hypothetical protein